MKSNKTSVLAVAAVAMLMICALTGVIYINNNSESKDRDYQATSPTIAESETENPSIKCKLIPVDRVGAPTITSDALACSVSPMTEMDRGEVVGAGYVEPETSGSDMLVTLRAEW